MDDIITKIKTRRKHLAKASKQLKKHFVGLDKIIDKIFKDVETWYVMPELLTRPVIICLWGLTGVGKTDFVRRFVKELSVADRFCEIEMSNKGCASYPWENTISAILGENPQIGSGESCVILLDEMQNYRSIDHNGHDLHDTKLRDVWQLLSDGKLPYKADVDYLYQMLWDCDKRQPNEDDNNSFPSHVKPKLVNEDLQVSNEDNGNEQDPFEDDENGNPILTKKMSYYSLNRFRKTLRLDTSIEEIHGWSDTKKKEVVLERINNQSIFKEEDFSKALIFISGNLDEAYPFASETDESDIDADVFHEMSLKISMLDIKRALTKRFKPEQIARFGNSHVIYPSLSTASYKSIIKRRIVSILKGVKEKCDIDINIDNSIYKLIYDNGVFPTQGTRPVFSTIAEIVESSLPRILLKALLNGERNIDLAYEENNITTFYAKSFLKIPYSGVLDTIKAGRNKQKDLKSLIAVHESGHAVVYATLFKTAPPQIVASTASSWREGFVYTHEICGSKEQLIKRLAVMLASSEAEKIVFGEDQFTCHNVKDVLQATELAARMMRSFSMGDNHGFVSEDSDHASHNIENTDLQIEAFLADAKNLARSELNEHINLFMDVSDELRAKGNISPENFKNLCKNHSVIINVKKSDFTIINPYGKMYESFCARKKKKLNQNNS